MARNFQGYSLLEAPKERKVAPALSVTRGISRFPVPSPTEVSHLQLRDGLSIVQFACPLFYVHEERKEAVVVVMRIGMPASHCSVDFKTEDISAKAGDKYVQTTGTITFDPDEEMKSIRIPILRNDTFDANLSFRIVLESPNFCVVAPYLQSCQVVIVDDDIFPSPAIKNHAALDKVGLRVLAAFIVFCIRRIPLVGWRTFGKLLFDQFDNAIYWLSIWLKVYLVDVVFGQAPDSEKLLWVPGSPLWTAVLVALALTVPRALLSVIDYLQIGAFSVPGKVTSHLKVNLYRKYLHYSSQSYAKVSPQVLLATLEGDIPQVTKFGFMVIFKLAQQIVKVGVILFFLIRKRPSSVLLLLMYPIAMAIVLNLRYLPTLLLEDKVSKADVDTLKTLRQSIQDINLIKEYRMRGEAVAHYENSLKDGAVPKRAYTEYDFRTTMIMPWITNLAVGVFVIVGGYFVLNNKLSLGAFLAILSIYKDAGELFQSFYDHLKSCNIVIGPLLRVVDCMNLSTDEDTRIQQFEQCHQGMIKQLSEMTSVMATAQRKSRFDQLHIRLVNLSLANDRGGPQNPNLQKISASVPQGVVVAVLGPHGCGKYSLLRLLRGSVMPNRGQVHVPTYCISICVPRSPQLLHEGDLLQNVTFGSHRHYDRSRLLQICKLVGLSNYLIEMLEAQIQDYPDCADCADPERVGFRKTKESVDDERHTPWFEQISQSELLKLHIIRALHLDPEVLLLQRPVDEMEADHAARFLALIRSFVDNRGILKTPEEQQVARPRTVFFSSGADRERAETAIDCADLVWHLSEEGFEWYKGGDAPRGEKHKGPTGNKILDSWCKETQRLNNDLNTLRAEHDGSMQNMQVRNRELHVSNSETQLSNQLLREEMYEAKDVLQNVERELVAWVQEQEQELIPLVGRGEITERLQRLINMIRAPGSQLFFIDSASA